MKEPVHFTLVHSVDTILQAKNHYCLLLDFATVYFSIGSYLEHLNLANENKAPVCTTETKDIRLEIKTNC